MWLELALDYRCNLRCVGCHACFDDGASLPAAATRARLEEARARGVTRLWLGGGEPTLRDDLLRVIATARSLGFTTICLQTNCLRLAYPAYLDALIAAGVTEFRVNAKSHDAAVHDRLSGRDGSHALLGTALGLLHARGQRVLADVLVTRSNGPALAETVRFFAGLGVSAFSLWWLSAVDDEVASAEVPRFVDLGPALTAAAETAQLLGVGLESLHTPPCVLPPAWRALYHPVSELALVVVEPKNQTFDLERSPIEGGAYLPGCAGCSARPRCLGPRADYIRLHGGAEFVPL